MGIATNWTCRTLPADVPNPDYDRRYRHGDAAIPHIPTGTQIAYDSNVVRAPRSITPHWIGSDFAKALIHAVRDEPDEKPGPETLIAILGWSYTSVLEDLLRLDLISPGMIEIIAQQPDKETD